LANPELRDVRSTTFRVGGQQLLVLSYAADAPDAAPLTRGEAEVARLAAAGHTNAQIAEARGTATRTVANQMASILAKLGISSRRELAVVYHGARRRSSK
jgi:DNA-binding NarL/FixJ family response regulator